MRILAVDYGHVRIGLASGDDSANLPAPLDVYSRTASVKKDAHYIASLAAEIGAELIVVGIPLDESGEKGQSAISAEQFANRVSRYTKVAVVMWDERLSSAEALERLREMGVNERDARKRLDSVAAAIILEDYLASRERNHKQ